MMNLDDILYDGADEFLLGESFVKSNFPYYDDEKRLDLSRVAAKNVDVVYQIDRVKIKDSTLSSNDNFYTTMKDDVTISRHYDKREKSRFVSTLKSPPSILDVESKYYPLLCGFLLDQNDLDRIVALGINVYEPLLPNLVEVKDLSEFYTNFKSGIIALRNVSSGEAFNLYNHRVVLYDTFKDTSASLKLYLVPCGHIIDTPTAIEGSEIKFSMFAENSYRSDLNPVIASQIVSRISGFKSDATRYSFGVLRHNGTQLGFDSNHEGNFSLLHEYVSPCFESSIDYKTMFAIVGSVSLSFVRDFDKTLYATYGHDCFNVYGSHEFNNYNGKLEDLVSPLPVTVNDNLIKAISKIHLYKEVISGGYGYEGYYMPNNEHLVDYSVVNPMSIISIIGDAYFYFNEKNRALTIVCKEVDYLVHSAVSNELKSGKGTFDSNQDFSVIYVTSVAPLEYTEVIKFNKATTKRAIYGIEGLSTLDKLTLFAYTSKITPANDDHFRTDSYVYFGCYVSSSLIYANGEIVSSVSGIGFMS